MPYIGNTIRAADDYRLIDDISSGFNGSATSFALQVAGSAPVPFPKSPQQILISVNGVIQEPDPTGSSGFNLVGTNIVFSSAPANGHAFFGIIYATADYLNAGGNFPAGALGSPSITFIGDENTGLYRKGSGSVGFVSDATEIANFDSNGITISSGNLIIPGDIIHSGDANTKIRFSDTDQIKLETGSVQKLRLDNSEVVVNDDGADVNFRVEGDTDTNLIVVDASEDKVGIGTGTPSGAKLHIVGSGNTGIKVQVGSSSADQIYLGNTGGASSVGTLTYVGFNLIQNGGVALTVNTSKHVGIKTTTPEEVLDLGNDTQMNLKIGGRGYIGQAFSTAATILGHSVKAKTTGTTSGGMIITETNSGGGAPSAIRMQSGNIEFHTAASGTQDADFNSNERVRITSSGNVGIGTTSPSAALHINTGAVGLPKLRLQHSGTGNDVFEITSGLTGVSNGGFGIYDVDETAYRFVINSSGNVGIGTTSPSNILHATGSNSSTGYQFINTHSTDGFGVRIAGGGTTADRYALRVDDAASNERFRINANGKVGIGTNSPGTLLHLSSADPRIKLTDTDGPLDVNLINSSGDFVIDTPSVHRDLIVTSVGQTNEIARFTGDGKVGIGTSAPSSIVDVSAASGDTILELNRSNSNTTGNVGLINFTASDGHSVGSIGMSGDGDNEGGNVIFRTTSAAASSDPFNAATPEVMRIDSSGNVGIGTTSPSGKLNLATGASSACELRLTSNNTGAGSGDRGRISVHSSRNDGTAYEAGKIEVDRSNGTEDKAHMMFFTNNGSGVGERLRITHAGKLLFGTTDGNGLGSQFVINSSTDDVFGIRFPTENMSGLMQVLKGFVSGTPSGTCSFIQFQRNDGGVRGSITANGAVNLAFNTSSDYRLKENIVSISDGITRLKTLKPSRFNWKEDSSRTVDGFLAHEVSTAIPEAVTGTKDAVDENGKIIVQQLDLSKIVPLLTAALQEAIAKIETLETEVAALKAA